jgi:hypothetical protein
MTYLVAPVLQENCGQILRCNNAAAAGDQVLLRRFLI